MARIWGLKNTCQVVGLRADWEPDTWLLGWVTLPVFHERPLHPPRPRNHGHVLLTYIMKAFRCKFNAESPKIYHCDLPSDGRLPSSVHLKNINSTVWLFRSHQKTTLCIRIIDSMLGIPRWNGLILAAQGTMQVHCALPHGQSKGCSRGKLFWSHFFFFAFSIGS